MKQKSRQKTFLQHPHIYLKKDKQLDLSLSEKNPEEDEQIRQWLFSRKRHEIQMQRQQLNKIREENNKMEQQILNHEEKSRNQREERQEQTEQIQEQLQQVQKQIELCRNFEDLDVSQFVDWRYNQAKQRHFQKVQEIRKKYSQQNSKKMEKIAQMNKHIDQAKKQLRQLETIRDRERTDMVVEEIEEEIQLPNIRALGSQLNFMRDKIKTLRDTKKLMVDDLKVQLNSSTWSVKETFEASKDRINKEIKKLLSYLDKPDKEIAKMVSDKVPNPSTIIEAYEIRLAQLERDLPPQLRTDQILKCLKPLPFRNIKGSNIDPNNSATAEVLEKFNKMQREYVEVQTKNGTLKASLKEKQTEVERLTKMLAEAEEKLKQLKK